MEAIAPLDKISGYVFYIAIIMLASLLAQLSQMISSKNGRNYGLLLLIGAYLIITLPVALRYNTGADYNNYVLIFETIKEHGIHDPIVSQLEIGYLLLNYICAKLFDDYQFVFIIMAFLTNYFFFKAFVYEAKKINLGLAVFVYGFTLYFWSFIIIRNMLGIAIIFYALKYIFERKIVQYFFFVTIAVLFHYSLVIFYPVGILYMEKLKKYRIPLAIMSVLLIPIIPMMIIILSSSLAHVLTRFASYSFQIQFSFGRYVILCALPLIPFSIYYKKLKALNRNISLYLSFYIISIVILSFASTTMILTRYVYALWPSLTILFASLLQIFDDIIGQRKKFIVKSLVVTSIVSYGVVLMVYFVHNDNFYMIPYQMIFQR